MIKKIFSIVLITPIFLFGDCYSGIITPIKSINKNMNDKFEIGTIIDIRPIEITQNNYLPTIGGGALGGAVIGGLLGSKKKIGKNMLKGAAIGAIGGGIYNEINNSKIVYEILVKPKENEGNLRRFCIEEKLNLNQELKYKIENNGSINSLEKNYKY